MLCFLSLLLYLRYRGPLQHQLWRIIQIGLIGRKKVKLADVLQYLLNWNSISNKYKCIYIIIITIPIIIHIYCYYIIIMLTMYHGDTFVFVYINHHCCVLKGVQRVYSIYSNKNWQRNAIQFSTCYHMRIHVFQIMPHTYFRYIIILSNTFWEGDRIKN